MTRVEIERDSLYVAGRYNKLVRTMSQTPWLLDNDVGRPRDPSVADFLTAPIRTFFNAQGEPRDVQQARLRPHKESRLLTRSDATTCGPLTDVIFSSSGREDLDVRMLGRGRPFVLDLPNARTSAATYADLRALEAAINASAQGKVTVRDLQLVDRDAVQILRDGEESKEKTYSYV